MSKYNWTRQETKDLITLYEVNECLWNKNLREYKDRDERVSSIQSISDEMKIPIEEINKKIHNLRNQYRFELNKMKKDIPGKARYQTKWPYFKNLSFLENIVSVRGSSNPQNSNGDYNEANDFTMDETEISNDQKATNNGETTIVTTNSQPQQIFHVSVEYEEEAKPKPKAEIQNTRKRRMVASSKEGVMEIQQQQQQLLTQYTVAQTQPATSSSVISKPAIIIEEKIQDQIMNECEEVTTKIARTGGGSFEDKKLDKFDIFGLFIANEMKSLTSVALQKKMKRKILECILEINDDQEAENIQS